MALDVKTKIENQFERINDNLREPIKTLTFEWALDKQKSLLGEIEDKHNQFWEASGLENLITYSRHEDSKFVDGKVTSKKVKHYLMPECVEECLKEVLSTFRKCGIAPEGKGKYITK